MTGDQAAASIGRKVVYRPPHVREDEPGDEGVITSVNDVWVFVRYGADTHSKATPASRLTLVGAL